MPAGQRRAAADGLVRVVESVQARAPQVRVVLVDYLPLFTASSTPAPTLPLTEAELDHSAAWRALSEAYAEASGRTGADLLPASAYAQDHSVGPPEPWVHGLRLGRSLPSSFHPTPAGMRVVADGLGDLLAADPPG